MATYAVHVQTKVTPQSEPIPGTDQIQNSAGGFTWTVDKWTRLDRFLILGCEGGSYYAGERKLTQENAACVKECLDEDYSRTMERIAEISDSGRAPKNDPAIFALALAVIHPHDWKYKTVLAAKKVIRTGTHQFMLAENLSLLGGWGRAKRNILSRWYQSLKVDQLAYQMCKYRNRCGWTHRDLIRVCHAHPFLDLKPLFKWAVKGEIEEGLPTIIPVFERMQKVTEPDEAVAILKDNPNMLSWEMIPTPLLASNKVWKALLPQLPMTALLRNLGRMTANGTLQPLSDEAALVNERFRSEEKIKKSRLHPISILNALMTYRSGRGVKGALEWTPIQTIKDALEDAFYISFLNVAPTGKRFLLALDVSGSMRYGDIAGMPGITPAIGSAAMAMVTARTEPNYHIMGFSHHLVPLDITAKDSLSSAVQKCSKTPFGATDCALPMIWALENKVRVDTFVVYTDSETWHGYIHPSQALHNYRKQMGIPAKLVVVGMVANEFTIADPNDSGMLDVVGFDTATPQLISDFSLDFGKRGE